MRLVLIALLLLVGAVAGGRWLGGREGSPDVPAIELSSTQAYAKLGSRGPERFARVGPGLYRGGQPSRRDLRLLRALDVRTIIDLRRGRSDGERAAAEQAGLRFLSFPLDGTSTPSRSELDPIVEAMRAGNVYVHCKAGRDRTSLVVALYRVRVDGWPPDRAWQSEARAFGHHGLLLRSGLERAFRLATR
jgi:protein tyrosine phosphatase (PTP) superfamily phosphohydrolase (DUF442 family)